MAMQRTSAQRWEEAAPLIQGWGLVKGCDYWEAKAFGGKKWRVGPSLGIKNPSRRSTEDKVGLRFHPAWGSAPA